MSPEREQPAEAPTPKPQQSGIFTGMSPDEASLCISLGVVLSRLDRAMQQMPPIVQPSPEGEES